MRSLSPHSHRLSRASAGSPLPKILNIHTCRDVMLGVRRESVTPECGARMGRDNVMGM